MQALQEQSHINGFKRLYSVEDYNVALLTLPVLTYFRIPPQVSCYYYGDAAMLKRSFLHIM